MLQNRNREKFIQAILYFAHNTAALGKVKLFKLLYLLDFAHFRETGLSVTGLDYNAWKFGPVPEPLMQEWEQLGPDLATAVTIEPELVFDYVRETVVPKVGFDDSLFTKRELRLMRELAGRFRDEMTQPMVNYTHAERGPWDKIWDSGRGSFERIPYSLAVPDDDPNRDAILDAALEYDAMAAAISQRH
jgi:uncharacterized phage-associated protein